MTSGEETVKKNTHAPHRAAAAVLACLFAFAVPATAFAQTDESAAEATDFDSALMAVGTLGISNLYFTFITLGTVADGYVAGGYTPEQSYSFAEDVGSLSAAARDRLQVVLDTEDLVAEDSELIQLMIDAHEILEQQARGLIAFVDDPENREDFSESRQIAWRLISGLMGLGSADD